MAIEIKAGRELDEFIARYVMVVEPQSEPVPHNSTDPAAAQRLADRLRSKGFQVDPREPSPVK